MKYLLMLSAALFVVSTVDASAQIKSEVDIKNEVDVKSDDITLTKDGWKADGKTQVKTEAGTVIEGDTAEKTEDGIQITGDDVLIKTEESVILAEDGDVMIKDNTIEVIGDTIQKQTVKPKQSVKTPADMEQDNAPVDVMKAPAAETTVNINCPEGTTAQPDKSCMVTGEFNMSPKEKPEKIMKKMKTKAKAEASTKD